MRPLHHLAALCGLMLAAVDIVAAAQAGTGNAELIGMNHDPAISEISGAAISHFNSQQLFAVNDSQNSAALHLISAEGTALGQVRVNAAKNHDWEDLAAFTLEGTPHLLIADTGDNGGLRAFLTLYIVAEPARPLPDAIDVAWRIDFKLPEGARDIEAVAVDAKADTIYLIAKRHFPRVLYRLPLRPKQRDAVVIAENIGTFNTLPPANNVEKNRDPKFGRFQGDITALALDAKGERALVLSYRDLYVYTRTPGEPLLKSLSRKPRRLHLPPMPQAEAIALDQDSNKAIVISERLLSPIYRVAIP
jgi:hypothetical protein